MAVATKRRPHGAQEYRGNGNHFWEDVSLNTDRLRVPGGWLYKVESYHGIAIEFVPTPEVVGYAI